MVSDNYSLHFWKTLFYVLTDNILQPLLFLWSLTLKLSCSKRSSIIYPAKVVFYLYSNIYVALTHLIPIHMHMSVYLKNGMKKKFEKSYLVSLRTEWENWRKLVSCKPKCFLEKSDIFDIWFRVDAGRGRANLSIKL